MGEYKITCSSTCDLTKDYLKAHNIPYVNFKFMINSKEYIDDFYDNISVEDFCKQIKDGEVKTSQPEPEQYINMWDKILKEGKDVLHLEVSTGITGAYNSACIARDMLSDVYPDRHIEVVDTKCCSTGYGVILMQAVEKMESGLSLQNVLKYIDENKLKIHHIFIPNIEQLAKGGRIPKAIGAILKVINIVFILDVDNTGHLRLVKKVRGMKVAINEMVKMSESIIENGLDYDGEFYCTHVNAYDQQIELYNAFKNHYKNGKFDINNIYKVGSVIASHSGEGTVSIFFMGKER